ncbi:TRAM domain-containing protein [Haloterrigena sp. SYSU A121-1]|uniref:TRAM domain-containing protein n=1 Tax=Haloterrigena gelatinilytica TaxID=2741724 RepID=A0A8J8KIW1_9EURY|nr:TRAM domain-containing protein [Haloterrigena gelatinilytica]NUB92669.1 TRAM domain-containing protein [Haloterrigena gelatinilytica]
MSLFSKYLEGWRFRSSEPTFEPGDEISVFVAESNGTDGRAYVGDTRLTVEGAGPETVEKRVRVRVTEFDDSSATGRGELLEVVGESSYTG